MREGDAPPPAIRSNETFEAFIAGDGRRLRRALVAHYGTDIGPDVAADALAWAWEHWVEVEVMANPAGYLYRVAQSRARRHWRWRRRVVLPPEEGPDGHGPEPGLARALASLPDAQRVAVLLVHAHGHSYEEAAALLDIPVSTIRNHVHRGMAKLRKSLGVADAR
jgi:RNA polymerase sigma-70 factor (ECF subfamily)